MFKTPSTEAVSRGCARRPWLTIGIWVAVIAAAIVLMAGYLPGALTTKVDPVPSLESNQGQILLEQRLRGPEKMQEIVIVRSETATVDAPAFQKVVESVYGKIVALGPETVEGSISYYLSGDKTLVSADGRTTLIPVILAGDYAQAFDNVPKIEKIVDEANGQDGFEVLTTGTASFGQAMMTVSQKDAEKAEMIGMPVALITLVLVFGAVVAAVVPLGLGIVAIVVALGTVAAIGQAYHLFVNVTNIVSCMGLAVGIDYSLFVISRFREERRKGVPKEEAIARTGATAGRSIFFSGMTVVIALSSLFFMPDRIFRGMAIGGISVVAATVIASLTLLPAVLHLLGDKVNGLRIPFIQRKGGRETRDNAGGFWDRAARTVMRHPVVSLLLAGGLLLAAVVPYFDMKTGSAGISTLPNNLEAKKGFSILEKEFSGGLIAPAEIVIDGRVTSEPVRAAIERLQNALAADPSMGPSRLEVNPAGNLGVLTVLVPGDPQGSVASEAVERIRKEYVPRTFAGVNAKVMVAGQTAQIMDSSRLMDEKMPYVIGFVLSLSFIFLTIVFRSLVVPVKAIIMNLLSVGAAYGLLVLVLQKGVGASLLGLQKVDTIESWLPIFLFTMLFGLSMDYHVFLISRIRERYDQTHDNTEAVAFGLRSTGGIITGAAIIMVAVFAAFGMGDMVMMQQMGFGMAVAVLMDATIVRSVLVPASMKLLGHWNWYLPSVLHWLPDLRVEGPALKPARFAEPVRVAVESER